MAPRHVPRGLRNLDTDGERRSRYNSYLREALEMDPDMSYVEVPDHLVAPKGRTKREIMKRAAILKCGSTGYGCPVGFSGYVTYPASEIEKQLLNSAGAGAAAAPPAGAGAAAPVGGAVV